MSTRNSDKPRFNVADIIIIVALIAVITAFALRVYNVFGERDDTVQVRIAFEVSEVSSEEILLKEKDALYLSEDDTFVGTLEKFTVSDTRRYVYNKDGKLVKATVSGKSDVTGTIVIDCVKTEKGYYLGGTRLLSEGDTLTMYTKMREMSFRIIKITEIEKDANGKEIVNTTDTQVTTAATTAEPAAPAPQN
jgi:hypothetical protein